MKTNPFSSILTHTLPFLQVIIVLSLAAVTYHPSKAQSITQPPQIAWGRYFDDVQPGFNWAEEDLGDKIYYFENNIYIVGRTKSDTNAFVNCSGAPSSGDGSAFLASYNPPCNTYNWITYFGGFSSVDYAYCAAFDKVGDTSWIYIAGETNELGPKSELPWAQACATSGCPLIFQQKPNDKKDAWIAKYNLTSGKLVRWTYIGGKGAEQILNLAVDTVTHNVYFLGYTESPAWLDYASLGFTPYKGDFTGSPGLAFFGSFDSCLSTLNYYSYYGGNGWDRFHALEILYANNTRYLVMSGTTQSKSGIVPSGGNTWDNTFGGKKDLHNPDGFLVIWDVNTLSSPPNWSTYVGGSDVDRGRGIDLTSTNDIYFVEQTLSSPDTGANAKFVPTSDAYMPTHSTRYESVLLKFHIDSFNAPMGVHLELLTYIGGDKSDYAKTVRAFHTNNDSNGTDSVVVAGLTYSNDLPSSDSSSNFFTKTINGNGEETKRDAFIAVLTKDPAHPEAPQKLSSFAYLGGERDETDVKVDSNIVQKSYNPGLALGPNGSVFIIYTTFGSRTKSNGKIPYEFSAFHAPADSTAKLRTDAYFAQVYPFTQHFIPSPCTIIVNKENAMSVTDGDVSFYPVPFSTVTTLNVFTAEEQNVNISIYDFYGRMIMEKKVSLQADENKVRLDFTPYPAGMYMSKLTMDGKVYELKITKQQ
ncbi:MAG TPA: T9SS type A sorting domain-containing protein [Chitinophagales bacterium]|nr:T9SS type A sorting domain-containing protein [Chitinophagales bacterium]